MHLPPAVVSLFNLQPSGSLPVAASSHERRFGRWRPVIGQVCRKFLRELVLDDEFLESERLETRLQSQPVQPRELQLVLDPEYL